MKRTTKTNGTEKKLALEKQTIRELKTNDLEQGSGARKDDPYEPQSC